MCIRDSTITIMTLAAANTLGIQVSLPAAIVLSAMSALDGEIK